MSRMTTQQIAAAVDNPLDRVLSKLQGVQCVGDGKYKALCPAHDDHDPSLSVDTGDDGKVLLTCRSQHCETAAIVREMGLSMSDLFPANGSSHTPNGKPPKAEKPAKPFDSIDAALNDYEKGWANLGPVDRDYLYRNAKGEEVGCVLRWNLPDDKVIKPVSLIDGKWYQKHMPDPRPLYNLPEILAADSDVIYLHEGEECCEKFSAHCGGAESVRISTTTPGGSNAAHLANYNPLTGRSVVIIRDNDEPGIKYAATVSGELLRRGCKVKIVVMPGVPVAGDIVDWLDTFGEAAEPQGILAAFDKIVDAVPWLDSQPIESEKKRNASETSHRDKSEPSSSPILIPFSQIEPREVSWLWKNKIPLGRITVIGGPQGNGKSFTSIDFAARISTGTPWPDGEPCNRGDVIIISCEDDVHDTIRPRLDAHYADVTRVLALPGVERIDKDGKKNQTAFTLADVDALEYAILQRPECRAIIIDPIGGYVGRISTSADNEVREVLAPVNRLAEKYNVAVIVIAHHRKASGNSADDMILGSRAFTALARAVWHVFADPDDENRRLFLAGKNNLAPKQPGLAFSIMGDPPSVNWERDAVTMTANECLQAQQSPGTRGPPPTDRKETESFITERLMHGPRPSKEIEDEAIEILGVSKPTIQRAKKNVGVESFRPTIPGPWFWRLPT